jgi:effector-binding domain-containing protein
VVRLFRKWSRYHRRLPGLSQPGRFRQVTVQTTAAIRCQAQKPELPQVVPRLCGEVWEFARAAELVQPGRLLALYREGTQDLEVGVEVAAPFVGTERVVCSSLPAGQAAVAVHYGPYELLGEAHAAVRHWCADRGLALAGPFWELYGHGEEDPAKRRTDVFYLVDTVDKR